VCGICGIVPLDSSSVVERSTLQRMMEWMRHRGPDDEGLYLGAGVGLGMRRLSIIDLAGGRQPIQNEDDSLHVVLNGEIYNFRALRKELLARGHTFSTRSDTEVIVHLYEERGEQCVHSLRGMFAFALWDEKAHRLLIARDRMGIKPLYYWQGDGRLAFASEVRALLASGIVPQRLSPGGLRSYLAYGAVQEPLTLIENVYSLLPGHLIRVQDGKIQIERYWDLPTGDRSPKGLDKREVQEQIRETLTEAVRLRLVSDVPLGAFLSGGIDSGAVVGLMSQVAQEPVRTFTISFEEQGFDESHMAEVTARRWGTRHTDIVVPRRQVLRDLPQALAAMDQPTVDGINTWYVSRATKQAGITVALSGLGGDELFAGYSSFREIPWMMRADAFLRRAPSTLRRVGAASVKGLLPDGDRGRKVAAFLAGAGCLGHPYFSHRMLFTPEQQQRLLRQDIAETSDAPWREKVARDIARAGTYDVVGGVSYLELRNYMLNTLLRDADGMSMAHSLEMRVPLIDHVLVEQAIDLPGRLKVQRSGGVNKPLLVGVLDGVLPSEIARAPKSTFTFPWADWLRGPLRSEVEQALGDDDYAFDGVLSSEGVSQVWWQFLAGETSWARPWALYVLKHWVETNLR
jgi:asparagine synthase (glutamine-hydrolysing)